MPSVKNISTSHTLTNVMVQYGLQEFVADILAPAALVKFRSNVIFSGGKEKLKAYDAVRRAGASATLVDFDYSSTTYKTVPYALRTVLDDDQIDNAEKPIDLRANSVEILTSIIKLNHEIRWQAIMQDTSVVTQHTAVGAAWNGSGDVDPKNDVDGRKRAVRNSVGADPTHILFSCDVRDGLVNYLLGKAQITFGQAATQIELPDTVYGMTPVVPKVVKNTANIGQTESLSNVWSDYVLVCVVSAPSTSYTGAFLTLRRTKIGSKGYRVRRWYDEEKEAENIECQTEEDEVAVNVSGAALLTGALG